MIKAIREIPNLATILGMLVLAMNGCNTAEPDKTPPETTIVIRKSVNLESRDGKYLFGVTDTIEVGFSEKIDTAALSVEFKPLAGIAYQFAGASKLLIFGSNLTYGTGHFNLNSPFTLTLNDLRDPHGNRQARMEAAFQPYAWVDQDQIDSLFEGVDSLFATDSTWIDGRSTFDSLITEGALDFKRLSGRLDYSDLKVVSLTGGDILNLTLTTRKDLDLNLKVAGPYTQAGLDSILAADNLDSTVALVQTGTKGFASVRISADLAEYKRKFKDTEAKGLYLLYIGISQSKEGFYRLGTRIHPFQ